MLQIWKIALLNIHKIQEAYPLIEGTDAGDYLEDLEDYYNNSSNESEDYINDKPFAGLIDLLN